jgi:hypothetical protein
VTPKGRDGLTEACDGGQPMQIFSSNAIDTEMIGLRKFSEEPIEIKLPFIRDNIRFRRFSTTNPIYSCGFDSGRIWGEKGQTISCPGIQKQLVAFRETSKFYLRERTETGAVSQLSLSLGDKSTDLVLAITFFRRNIVLHLSKFPSKYSL